MAGRGPAPSANRRRRNAPARGEWTPTPGVGWQHGPIPEPARAQDLSAEALDTWRAWMESWFAANWSPADLPGLAVCIHLYEQTIDYQREPFLEKEYVTTKGETRSTWVIKPNPVGDLRQMMDNYGITLKGQQDRRWVRGETTPAAGRAVSGRPKRTEAAAAPYRHLSVVPPEGA